MSSSAPAFLAVTALSAHWVGHKGAAVIPEGAAVQVESPAGGVVETEAALEWQHVGELRVSIAVEQAATVEVLLAEADRAAWFWRRVDLDPGPNALALPLAWFRWSEDRHLPAWERVDRLALRFRGAADATIGAVGVVPGDPRLDAGDLAAIAEPPLSRMETPVVRLLWDAPALPAGSTGWDRGCGHAPPAPRPAPSKQHGQREAGHGQPTRSGDPGVRMGRTPAVPGRRQPGNLSPLKRNTRATYGCLDATRGGSAASACAPAHLGTSVFDTSSTPAPLHCSTSGGIGRTGVRLRGA